LIKKAVVPGLLVLLVLLVGCSTDSLETKIDYKSAGSLPPLEVPPDLTAPSRDSRFTVPESGKSAATLSGYEQERKDQGRAGSTVVLPQVEKMRVERAGSERWLVVQEQQPEKLWPLVKEFWQENGFLIKTELPEAGVMETDWAESRAKIPEGFLRDFLGKILDQVFSTSERDKFRTRLERSPDGKSTEIYISHRGMAEVYTNQRTVDQTVWQPREPDPGLESEFLRRLMVRLGAGDARAKELTASGAPPPQRAELKKSSDGTELLQVNEPFDRAWRRVGLALDRVGFTVEDRDRQKGIYFVRYADPDAEMEKKNNEQGLLSKLFDFTSKDSKVKPEQYRVQVRQEQETSLVNVLNKEGAAESSKTAQRILTLLHEQLK
jgi:outer membrane protein assembly factor BamC